MRMRPGGFPGRRTSQYPILKVNVTRPIETGRGVRKAVAAAVARRHDQKKGERRGDGRYPYISPRPRPGAGPPEYGKPSWPPCGLRCHTPGNTFLSEARREPLHRRATTVR